MFQKIINYEIILNYITYHFDSNYTSWCLSLEVFSQYVVVSLMVLQWSVLIPALTHAALHVCHVKTVEPLTPQRVPVNAPLDSLGIGVKVSLVQKWHTDLYYIGLS